MAHINTCSIYLEVITMSDIANIIGQRLRQRRKELNYSQEYTSERAGLHPTYIGQLERGEKNATLESVEKVCLALDLPMEDLFRNIHSMDPTAQAAQQTYDLLITLTPNEQKALQVMIEQMIHFKRET
jgi:transcriptional regulator with XRE-family HTH domain